MCAAYNGWTKSRHWLLKAIGFYVSITSEMQGYRPKTWPYQVCLSNGECEVDGANEKINWKTSTCCHGSNDGRFVVGYTSQNIVFINSTTVFE